MIPYVNSAAAMLCPFLTGRMTVREITNKKVKIDGKLLLTESGAKLTGNGTCAILTAAASGSPQPCRCKNSCTLTGWKNVSQNQACGSSLLLKTSLNQCTVGGVISVSSSGQHKAAKGIHISVSSIEPLSAAVVTVLTQEKIQWKNEKHSAHTAQENTEPKSSKDSAVSKSEQILDRPQPSGKSRTSEMPFLPRTGLLCSCNAENPDAKCFECKYRLDRRTSPAVANDSQTLRRNYDAAKDQHDRYDRYVDNLFGFYVSDEQKKNAAGIKEGWSTAAHHIISGKQILEEFPRLVKLARFCGYDVDNDPSRTHGINHYPNCIILAGYPSDYGKIECVVESREAKVMAKSAAADEVMSKSGMQWHVGNHQYRFAKNEKKLLRRRQREQQENQAAGTVFRDNMQTVLGKRREFRGQDLRILSYAELVKIRLRELEEDLKKHPVCYINNDSAKQEFIRRMEKISRDIKEKLEAFCEKPHRSYPYFVSLESYLYAFAVPRTVHAVLVKSYHQGIKLMSWRITRYADTLRDSKKSLSFEPVGDGMYLRTDCRSDEDLLKCLKICAKARHFLLGKDIAPLDLFFLQDAGLNKDGTAYFFRLTHSEQTDEKTLQENDSEIAVWLRQTVKDLSEREDLQCDMGVLRKRWEYWKHLKEEGNFE